MLLYIITIMAQNNYIPSNVGYAVNKLSGYSRNRYRLQPQSADTLKSSSILNIALPEGSVLDMSSLKIFFRATAVGVAATASPGSDAVAAKLPADASSLFSRCGVNLNGLALNGSTNDWGSYARLSKICRTSKDKANSIDNALQHGFVSASAGDEAVNMCLQDFPGTFINTASSRFCHGGALGSLSVSLTVAGADVLVPKGAGTFPACTADEVTNAAGMTFSLSDIYATIDCISLPPLFDEMLMGQMASEDLKINYTEVYTTANEGITSGSASTRFSVASQNVAKVLCGLRNGNHASTGPVAKKLDNSSPSEYVANKFRFRLFDTVATPVVKHSWSINNTPYPQYKAASLVEGIADSYYAVENDDMGQKSRGNMVESQGQFNDGRGVLALRLDHPTGQKPETRVCSGISTLGLNMSATFDLTGLTVPAAVDGAAIASIVCVETTPTLTVSAGKSCSGAF